MKDNNNFIGSVLGVILLLCIIGFTGSCNKTEEEHHATSSGRRSSYWYDDKDTQRRKANEIKDKYYDENWNQKSGVRNGKPVG